jgi:hypothetical protein
MPFINRKMHMALFPFESFLHDHGGDLVVTNVDGAALFEAVTFHDD